MKDPTKLTKQQMKNLRVYINKAEGLGLGLESLSDSLRETNQAMWKYAKSLRPDEKVIGIDWDSDRLLLKEKQ